MITRCLSSSPITNRYISTRVLSELMCSPSLYLFIFSSLFMCYFLHLQPCGTETWCWSSYCDRILLDPLWLELHSSSVHHSGTKAPVGWMSVKGAGVNHWMMIDDIHTVTHTRRAERTFWEPPTSPHTHWSVSEQVAPQLCDASPLILWLNIW